MGLKRHRQPLEIMAEMNITNLLDTAFILLITFMLVAPQLTTGVKISLPVVKEAPPLDMNSTKTVIVSISKKAEDEPEERILLGRERVSLEEIYEKVSTMLESKPDMAIVIKMDEASSSGMFVKVFAEIKRTGYKEQIGIQVNPASPKNRP